jgi:hypothetical protein
VAASVGMGDDTVDNGLEEFGDLIDLELVDPDATPV